jgi:hypothetical protein
MKKRITTSVRKLRAMHACPEQVAAVRKEWGAREFTVTATRLRKAAKLGLDVGWWFVSTFPEREQAYDEARATAWKAYDEARAPAIIKLLGL